MALSATMRRFDVSLSDSDRDVYEQLELRVAQHPSESERFLVARVLVRALEHAEGVELTPGGVSDDEVPALLQKDLRGDLQAWIEVGAPSPDRLHKATKKCKRVVVYSWKQPDELAAAIRDRKVYGAERIELFALDGEQLDAIGATLDRNNAWDVAITGGTVYLTVGNGTAFELAPRLIPLR